MQAVNHTSVPRMPTKGHQASAGRCHQQLVIDQPDSLPSPSPVKAYLVQNILQHRHVLLLALVSVRKEEIGLLWQQVLNEDFLDAQNDIRLAQVIANNGTSLTVSTKDGGYSLVFCVGKDAL